MDVFHNATTLIFEASKFNTHPDLYAGVDFGSLSALERAWTSWFRWWGNPILATGVFSFVFHELIYFGRCLPFVLIDHFRYFQRYKIQPDKVVTAKDQWECTKAVLKVHFTVELPQIYLFFPMAAAVGMQTYHVPFPDWKTIAMQVAIFFLVEDTWHYWAHRLFHIPFFYKNVHKLHHKYSAPFGLAAEFAHPFEVVTLGAGTVVAPLLYCYLSGGNMHIITMYIWIALRLFQAVDSHSGYDFPWSLRHWFPLWAGADHHDFHHQMFVGCYASSFRHWDWLFGTDTAFHRYRERQKRAREEKAVKVR